jgi:hypothetical protein
MENEKNEKTKTEKQKKDTVIQNGDSIEEQARRMHITLWRQITVSATLLLIVMAVGYAALIKFNPSAIPTWAGRGGGPSVPTLSLTTAFTNPAAAQQSTTQGKTIHEVHAHNGKIYTGFGDMNANTAGGNVYAFDPNTNTLTEEHFVYTEEVDFMDTFNGKLVIPAGDPGGGGNDAAGVKTSLGQWVRSDAGKFAHVFGACSLGGNHVALAGGGWGPTGDDSIILQSWDGGQTWDAWDAPSTLYVPATATSAGFNRFYFCGAYKNRLYTQSPFYDTSSVYDPTTNAWSTGPDLFPGTLGSPYGADAAEFAGQLVYSSALRGWRYGSCFTFDGTTARNLGGPIRDCGKIQVGDDGYLYVMGYSSTAGGFAIARTKDLTTWQWVGKFKYDSKILPFSFDILDGHIYIGFGRGIVKRAPLANIFLQVQ